MITQLLPIKSKLLSFISYPPSGRKKTYVVYVKNRDGETLGIMYYDPEWKKYVWEPSNKTKIDIQCNDDITAALRHLEGTRHGQKD